MAPASDLSPSSQDEHVVVRPSSLLYVFTTQSVQLSKPLFPVSLEYLPGVQSLHSVKALDPVAATYFPRLSGGTGGFS